MTMDCLANSEGQLLKKHLIAVGKVAGKICSDILKNSAQPSAVKEQLINQAVLAGFLHDVGKADPRFQKYILGQYETFIKSNVAVQAIDEAIEREIEFHQDKHGILHHQLSWWAIEDICPDLLSKLNTVSHAVYFHHFQGDNRDPKEVREIADRYKTKYEPVLALCRDMMQEFEKRIGSSLSNLNWSACEKGGSENVSDKPQKTIVLVALVTADRAVSKLGVALNDINLDDDSIFDLLPSATLKSPTKTLPKLKPSQIQFLERVKEGVSDNKNTFVLDAPPGSGKTTMGLSFVNLFTRHKDLFIGPRNTICKSLYDTITDDASRLNLNFTRELIRASQVVASTNSSEEPYSSELIIANIDSVLGVFFKHVSLPKLSVLLTEPMVIDEFHELLAPNTSILYLTRRLMLAREFCGAKTLLMSATPVDILHDLRIQNELFEGRVCRISLGIDTELDTLHKFKVVPAFSLGTGLNDVWFKCNTVAKTQEVFQLILRNGTVVHGRCDQADKESKLESVFKCYERGSVGNKPAVVSSTITECSLNLSYKDAELELSTPLSLLQCLGRVNRFGQNWESTVSLVLEERQSRSNKAYITSVYSDSLFTKWKDFVRNEFDGKTLKKSEVVCLIKRFNAENKADVESLICNSAESSKKFAEHVSHKRGKLSADKKIEHIVIGDGGLRGSAGWFGSFIKDDKYKLYQFNSTYDKVHFEKTFDRDYDKSLRRWLKGQNVITIDTMNFKFRSLINSQGSYRSNAFRAAKSVCGAIPLQFPGYDGKAFQYDDEPDTNKNLGIIKINIDSSSDDETDSDNN